MEKLTLEIQQRLEEFLREQGHEIKDKIIFEEQDATTLAANIVLFLNKEAPPQEK